MWFWSVMLVLGLPKIYLGMYATFSAFANGGYRAIIEQAFPESVRGQYAQAVPPSLLEAFNSYAYASSFFFSPLVLSLGLTTVLFPHLRGYYIERRYRLNRPPALKSLTEICEFVHSLAPRLGVGVNMNRPGLIFIYPKGFRDSSLAVFGGFVILWKTDREAAQAVLRHEVVHYRRGDALFMGPGGLLESSVKIGLLLFILLVVLPFALFFALNAYRATGLILSIREVQLTRGSSGGVEDYRSLSVLTVGVLWVVASNVLRLLMALTLVLLNTLTWLSTTVAGMWAAELNADYIAAASPDSRTALERELNREPVKFSQWRRLFFRLSHPPRGLRLFFLRSCHPYGLTLLLLLFPLSYLVQEALTLASQLLSPTLQRFTNLGLVSFQMPQASWGDVAYITFMSLASRAWLWLYTAMLLIVWPFTARRWELLFTRTGQRGSPSDGSQGTAPALDLATPAWKDGRVICHVVAGTLCGAVFVLLMIGYVLLVPRF
jgi:Zn-dependent protease with chaperone function